MKRVLITNITGYKAVVIASFLKKNYNDIQIFGIDSNNFSKIFHTNSIDKYFQITTDNQYIDSIGKIIREEDIDLLIPTHSNEMELLLKNRFKLGDSLDYFGSYESFQNLNNKLSLSNICTELNIKIPKSYNSLSNKGFPYVVKPSHSAASKGVMYIFDHSSYRNAKSVYQNKKNIVIQEYILGTGVGYSIFSKNGRIIVGYGHKRMAEHPVSGGSSVYRDEYIDKRMKKIASKIISHLDWSGFAMFEFKLTNENELFLIEVNPRIWGSINQGLSNGINYFSHLLGTPTNPLKNDRAYNTYLSPLVYISLFKYGIKLRLEPIKRFLLNISKNKPDISIIKDPYGWIGVVLRSLL